jgi:hypothetical protein
MANTDRPKGAVLVGTLSGGGSVSGRMRKRPVDSSNATAIFPGDFVILEDDGNVAPYTGTGGGVLLGVCMGVVVDRTVAETEHPGYLPATTAGNILVAEGTDLLFEVQDDGGATPTAAIIGSHIDVAATAGSTTTGSSAHELLMSSLTDASPGAAQLKIVDYVHADDNDPTAVNAKWIVSILSNVFTDTTGL